MSQIINTVQVRVKESSTSLFNFSLKLFIGMILGLTIALIFEEIQGELGVLTFTFITVTTVAGFCKIAKNWKLIGLLAFMVFCVLLGAALRLYILVAPGS